MGNDILLVSATINEVSDLLKVSEITSETKLSANKVILSAVVNKINYDLIITGPSIINTAHGLTIALEHTNPKIIIQAGYGGLFKKATLKLGDIVIVNKEIYIHTGIESDSNHLKPDALPFELIQDKPATKSGIYCFTDKYTDLAYQILRTTSLARECFIAKGPGITVSTITSGQKTLSGLSKSFSPLVEAMEGAALAHIALLYNLPFIEIRAGSNFAGERDKSQWNTKLASKRLSLALITIMKNILLN